MGMGQQSGLQQQGRGYPEQQGYMQQGSAGFGQQQGTKHNHF